MTKVRGRLWLTILALVLALPAAWAQQKDQRVNPPVAPYPPLSSDESSSKASVAAASTPTTESRPVLPDTRPLSGAEQLTLGSRGGARSYLLAGFGFSQIGDTNSQSTLGDSQLETASLLTGHIALRRVGRHSQFTANYTGGGALYDTPSYLNQTFQQLGITERFSWRRWVLRLADSVSYLPESSFGSGLFGGLGNFDLGFGGLANANLPNLSPIFAPNQAILTGLARRISNLSLGEVQYTPSPRSSFTASGSYGVLHFLDSGFINTSNMMFRTGYSYALTAQDSLAVIYGFSTFRFRGVDGGASNHLAHVAYGHRITGRLALQFSAGPQINTFRNPVAGAGRRLSWSMSSFLRYRFTRTDLELSYTRGITGGAGVLRGAQSDIVEMNVRRQLSRRWSGDVQFGYAHNRSLLQLTGISAERTFNAWYSRLELNRPLGRYTTLFFNYNLRRQSTDPSFCAGGACGTRVLRHYFGLGFDWHSRQIEIDW